MWWIRRRRAEREAVDGAVLARLHRIGGAQLVRQMIDLFLENAPRRIEAARSALRAGDIEGVGRAAHSLKTTAGNLGARRLLELSAEIERLAYHADGDQIPSLVRRLEKEYRPVRARLMKEREAAGE